MPITKTIDEKFRQTLNKSKKVTIFTSPTHSCLLRLKSIIIKCVYFPIFSLQEFLSKLDHLSRCENGLNVPSLSQSNNIILELWREISISFGKQRFIETIFGEEIFAYPIVSTFIPLQAASTFHATY